MIENKTGPRGLGQLTGRGMGPCGCGMGRGRRFARNRVISVSQPTIFRILESARKKVATALTKGKAIRIELNALESSKSSRYK
jgi:hypothetical protein